MTDEQQRWRTSDTPHGAPPSGGWGGEYDADATAFVQLPAEQPPAPGEPGSSEYDPLAAPLAAPGTGAGWEPPAIPPMTPAASTDPTATGQWTMPFAPVGEQYPDAGPADGPGVPRPSGQGAAAALAGAHEARTPAGPDEPAPVGDGHAGFDRFQGGEQAFVPQQLDPLDPATPLDVAAAQSGQYGQGGDTGAWTHPGTVPEPVAEPEAAGPPVADPYPPVVDHVVESAPPASPEPDLAAEPVPVPVYESEPVAEPDHAAVPEPRPAPDAGTEEGTSDPGPAAGAGPAEPGTNVETDEPAPVPDQPAEDCEHPLESYVLHVNGTERPVADAWIGESLLYVLRERLGLAGAKDGCSQGECGACSVQVDGRLVASCLVPAITAAASEVRTVEGLSTDGEPSDVQRALAERAGAHCGFCVPGMAMTVHDLLAGNHAPNDLEVRRALCGNLCRCSGYRGVLEAVREVADARAARHAEQQAQQSGEPPRLPQQTRTEEPGGAQ